MKVIELLSQGKKVLAEGRNGYYYIEDNELIYKDINGHGEESYDYIMMSLAMKEGKEYIPKKKTYFISRKGRLFRLGEECKKDDIIYCEHIIDCGNESCSGCPFNNDNRVKLDDSFKIHIIEHEGE